MMQFDPLDRPTVENLKFLKSKMAAAAILKKSKNRHISAAVGPILTTFGTVEHFHPLDRSHREKFEIFKFQDGGGRHLKKSINRNISAAFWPISTKFGVVT